MYSRNRLSGLPLCAMGALLAVMISIGGEAQARTWEQTNGPLGGGSVLTIAINSSGDIFAGTPTEGIFRSTDNGDNWVQINNGLLSKYAFTMVINSSGHIFVASDGLFRSINNGDSWEWAQNGISCGPEDLAVGPGGDVFAVCGGPGVYRSTDNGDNWSHVGLSGINLCCVAINPDGDVFVGSSDSGVYRSTDNGDNWMQVNTGLSYTGISAIASNASGHIFAADMDYGVFRSTDNGNNWTSLYGALPYGANGPIMINSDDIVFASVWTCGGIGGGQEVYASADNGDSWTLASDGITHFWINSLAESPNGDIFAGTGNVPQGDYSAGLSPGVFRTSDNVDSWVQVKSDTAWNTVYDIIMAPDGVIFAGAMFGLFRSEDSGETWSYAGNSWGNGSEWMFVTPTGTLFAQDRTRVARSTDYGESWTIVSDDLPGAETGWWGGDLSSSQVAVDRDGNVLIGTKDGVYRSLDNGDNWSQVGMASLEVFGLATNSAGDIFAIANDFGIYRSVDNGGTWQQIRPMSGGISAFAISSTDDIMVALGSTILRSNDNGDTWIETQEAFNNYVDDITFNSDGHVFAVTWDGHVYRSTDHGDSWWPVDYGLEVSRLYAVAVDAADNVFVGTHGAGVFRTFECNDTDDDWVCNDNDNCADAFNPDQEDTDSDGIGDVCDVCEGFDDLVDPDEDGVPSGCDNCPDKFNPDQADSNNDQIGDACCCEDRVGDANGLGGDEPTIGDVSVMIDAKFITGACNGIIACLAEADVNQSGGIDPTCDDITIGDISILIDYLFITGPTLGLAECL